MKLHILTLNWNGIAKLESLLPSLAINIAYLFKELDIKSEWHVRDNGSKDNSLPYLNNMIEGFSGYAEMTGSKTYDIGHNRDNFSVGVNYLFDRANPSDDDLVLLLNNDVVFNDASSLTAMVKLHLKTESDVVGARLLYSGTNKLQHAGVIFSEQYGRMPYHYRHKEESDKAAKTNKHFQAVTGAVMLVKASTFRKLNGFNVNFNWAFDDIDFCLRAGELKKNNIAYCGKTNIFHEESASLKKNPVNKMFLNQNVRLFKELWLDKYDIDHNSYLINKHYHEIQD